MSGQPMTDAQFASLMFQLAGVVDMRAPVRLDQPADLGALNDSMKRFNDEINPQETTKP